MRTALVVLLLAGVCPFGSAASKPPPHHQYASLQSVAPVEAKAAAASQPALIETKAVEGAQRKSTLIVLLGAMSGCSGALCKRRFGCYANMMTGNLARFANALADAQWSDALFYSLMICSYTTGVFLFRFFDVQEQKQYSNDADNNSSSNMAKIPFSIAPAALVAFALADVIDMLPHIPSKFMLPVMSVGFALINASSQSSIGSITNAATGHLTRVGLGVTDTLLLGVPLKAVTSLRFLVAFFVSILGTSLIYNFVASRNMQLPPLMGTTVGLLYMLLLSWYRAPRIRVNEETSGRERVRLFLYACLQRR